MNSQGDDIRIDMEIRQLKYTLYYLKYCSISTSLLIG